MCICVQMEFVFLLHYVSIDPTRKRRKVVRLTRAKRWRRHAYTTALDVYNTQYPHHDVSVPFVGERINLTFPLPLILLNKISCTPSEMYYTRHVFASHSELTVQIYSSTDHQLVSLVEYRSRTVTIMDSCPDGTKGPDRRSCCGCLVYTVS